jgi:hypothetical protein
VIGADAVINADLTVNNLRTPALINGVQSTRANSSSSIDEMVLLDLYRLVLVGLKFLKPKSTQQINLILKDSG